jgi:hypothetical protein
MVKKMSPFLRNGELAFNKIRDWLMQKINKYGKPDAKQYPCLNVSLLKARIP